MGPRTPPLRTLTTLVSLATLACAGASTAAPVRISRPALFDHVLPTDAPGEPIDGLTVVAARGEYEPATFVVRADGADLSDVTVTASDLTGPSTIPGDAIDIRVVKVWKQSGTANWADAPGGVLVPEPLVYDDAESLNGRFGGGRGSTTYFPPSVSQTLRTDIPAGTSKQFWLTLHVPEGAAAGTHSGELTVKTPAGVLARLSLALEVLPFDLLEPRQSFSTAYVLDPDDPLVREQLADIRRHGFKSMNLWVRGQSAGTVQRTLELLAEAGFEEPIALHAPGEENAAMAEVLKRSPYQGYLQGVGEPSALDRETQRHSVRHHIRESYDIHQLGMRVGVPIGRNIVELLLDPASEAYDQIDPLTGKTFRSLGITNEAPDYPQYYVGPDFRGARNDPFHDYVERLRAGTASKRPGMHEAMYWQAWWERPIMNRLVAGNYLWTSRIDGVSAVSYLGVIGGSFGDPNDDFDYATRSGQRAGQRGGGRRGGGRRDVGKRDNTLTLTSAQGPIPTLQWEALREAYDDVRYLTTLFARLGELRSEQPALADRIEREVEAELEKYHDPRDYERLGGGEFETTRTLLVSKIRQALAAEAAGAG